VYRAWKQQFYNLSNIPVQIWCGIHIACPTPSGFVGPDALATPSHKPILLSRSRRNVKQISHCQMEHRISGGTAPSVGPLHVSGAIVVAVPLATPRKAFSPHSAQPAALRFPRQLAAIPSRERRRFCPPTLRNACNAAGGWGDQAALDSAAFRNLVELCSGAPMHWTNQRLRARATWNDWEVRRERLNSLRLGSLSRAIES
jgi:hypothetical protein